MTELYVGLMSGTSADGIDAVLVRMDDGQPRLIGQHFQTYPDQLRTDIATASQSETLDFDTFFQLDREVGNAFAAAAIGLLTEHTDGAERVRAIGSHGQTVRHRPESGLQYTVQIGDPNVITARTGIDVVADFRRADMAFGGEGAPLAPLFHDRFLRVDGHDAVVLNLGGIANISALPCDRGVFGFDTGPANALMDDWIRHCRHLPYDADGAWAATGSVNTALLDTLMTDPYFSRPYPKSTGREHFNLPWLEDRLSGYNASDADVQATLCELTAVSVSDAIKAVCPNSEFLFVYGGGQNNAELMRRIRAHLPKIHIADTSARGFPGDFLEATMMAWLTYCYIHNIGMGIAPITGGADGVVLGGCYKARKSE